MKETINPLQLILPAEIYAYFNLVSTHASETDIHLYLDEKSIPPKEGLYNSKGFTEQAIIHDFPLRGKPVYRKVNYIHW